MLAGVRDSLAAVNRSSYLAAWRDRKVATFASVQNPHSRVLPGFLDKVVGPKWRPRLARMYGANVTLESFGTQLRPRKQKEGPDVLNGHFRLLTHPCGFGRPGNPQAYDSVLTIEQWAH